MEKILASRQQGFAVGEDPPVVLGMGGFGSNAEKYSNEENNEKGSYRPLTLGYDPSRGHAV